ncbi:hypothetical protein Bca52824_071891 [Brassica carinata]|uniref:Myb/SANT-like domain-containing protein n=1 Tax=Brassica carinata TaxID=52824 RepID=A0A8X7U3R1_BRACI|nr:hypothetical protein Bca52824_071891 [Brassica carinata]
MSGRRRGNTNPLEQRNSNVRNETTSRKKTLIDLFDQAISMNDYTLKDPTVLGREYMVDKFNRAFNLNINYAFFKNKLDDFKKAYKKWKFLMTSTGITVDPETSKMYASDELSFKREPPQFWDVMVRCFVFHDVYSQPQQSSRQRRQQILNEEIEEDDLHGFSDIDGDNIPQNNVPRTQENEEIYFLNSPNFTGLVLTHLKSWFFWRKYFIDIAGSNDEDKLQLLEAMTGVSRNNEDVPKQLGSGQLFGSPHSGGLSSGSQSSKHITRPRRGGLFNIWGTTEEPNKGHQSDSGDEE